VKKILFGFPIVTCFILGLASCNMLTNMTGIRATAKSSNSSGSSAPSLSAYKVVAVSDTRTDSNGNTLTQPYGTLVSTPVPRKQIYLSGPTYSGAPSSLIDYPGNTLAVDSQQTDAGKTAWTGYPHASVGARLGPAPGKQTIVSVVFTPTKPVNSNGTITLGQDTTGTVELVTWDGTTQTILHPFQSNSVDQPFDVWILGWSGAGNTAISVAAGDMEGNGNDEIAFCIGNYFVILGDDLSSILYQGWVTGLTTTGSSDTDLVDFHPSCVTAGDVYNNSKTEFVVTYGSNKTGYIGSYQIFAGATSTTAAMIASGSLTNGSASLSYADAALGDIDGSGTNALLFAGRKTNGNDCELIAATGSGATNNIQFLSNYYDDNAVNGVTWASNPLPALVCFDPDGKANNPRDLVLVWDRILSYTATATGTTTAGFGYAYSYQNTLNSLPMLTNVAAADVNYDNQDELIALSNTGQEVDVWGLNSAGTFRYTSFAVTAGQYPSLCVADVEGKSLTLEYLSKTVRYSNPQIVAVLASPPYYSDATSNSSYGSAGTSFGTASGSSESSSTSFTVSASFTIGVEAEAPLEGDAAKTSDKLTMGASFTAAFESEKDMSYSHYYTTGAGQDAVLFSCVPFDVYSYKVLSAPSGSGLGNNVTIDFPRQPQLIQMERTAFNGLPGNTLMVGSAVLPQTLGSPKSYPTKSAIMTDCQSGGGMCDVQGMTVPSGSSQTATDAITSTSSHTTTYGGGLSINASTEDVVMGVLFGASIGFEADFDYSVSTSASTTISGTVSGINSSDSSFQFGISGYNYTNAAIQPNPFMVVTYWVQ
jgi:hypothetical protein